MTRASLHAAVLGCALGLCLGAPRLAAGQAGSPLTQRPELKRLDELLTSGDTAAADTLLKALGPELGKNDRLAFDTIYVFVARGRYAEAKQQWNLLAPRLQERLRAAQVAAGKPGAEKEQRLLAEALFTQALLVARGGDAKEALQLMQQADGLGFPPLDSPLMLLAAECLVDLREYDLAASAYGEYVKRHPSDMTARTGFAAVLYSGGKHHEARKELEAVVRAAPKTPRANYTLAAVLFHLKLHDEARVHLERELALDPACAPCLSRLAHLAYLEGDDPRCEALLARSAERDASDLEALLVSGMLALRAGKFDVAIERLSRLVERSPEFPTGRFQLATAYRRAGQTDKAREQLEIYKRLLDEQKAREIGVRGSK